MNAKQIQTTRSIRQKALFFLAIPFFIILHASDNNELSSFLADKNIYAITQEDGIAKRYACHAHRCASNPYEVDMQANNTAYQRAKHEPIEVMLMPLSSKILLAMAIVYSINKPIICNLMYVKNGLNFL